MGKGIIAKTHDETNGIGGKMKKDKQEISVVRSSAAEYLTFVASTGDDKDSIEMNSKLAEDLGADSLDAIDIVMTIEDQYAIEVPDENIENMKTVEDIVSFIESNTDAN